MKAILTAALLAATLVPAQATPLDEAARTRYVGIAMKFCMESLYTSEAMRRLWTPTNIYNYCGCHSATISKFMTLEDVKYFAADKSPPDWADRVVNPADEYCRKKYLPTPDVSTIKDKSW